MAKYFPKTITNIDNLNCISLESLINNKVFNKGVLMPVGGYAEQDIDSILKSKVYDIHTKHEFCFWAHMYFNLDESINKFYEYLEKEIENDVYLIMTYTSAKKYASNGILSIEKHENIEEYKRRILKEIKDKDQPYTKTYKNCISANIVTYPQEMFPEILRTKIKGKNSAYLISELFYTTDDIPIENLCKSFKKYTIKKGLQDDCDYYNRPNHILIELKKDAKVIKLDLYNEKPTYVIAKLKYPYFVKLEASPNE